MHSGTAEKGDTPKGTINFQELISTGTTFEVDTSQIPPDEGSDDEVTKQEYDQEVWKHANFNCIGDFEDDEIYDSSEPFTVLESKMTDLLDHGGIKKRILRQGYGNQPEEKSIVRVHYNAYIEFNEEPFDCTYARKKPHTFVVAAGEVIPGLDFAVQSMKLNEKSQFLIKPDLAYGPFGCLDRIPANATVLFQIELLEIVESGAAENFENLPEEKKADFAQVYKYCIAQCAKGKDLFNRNVMSAIKGYNQAVAVLERAQLESYDEQVKQQELLYKLYSNLLVCYTRTEEPKRACTNFNKINRLARGTDIKISAKVFFNNAKCLRMLGDYDMAKQRLQKAYNLEPRNPEILREFKLIDELKQKYKEKEKKLASAFVGVGAKTKDAAGPKE